ncbi:MAG: hypothetical protein Q4P66_05960 [Actinomycetaceae bacterium]|nr:hypothetical protein [Actinomycetaceae bacterium]
MGWVRKPIDNKVINQARKVRAAKDLAHIDYLRAILQGTRVMSQTQVAEELGVTQPAISQVLRAKPEPQMPRNGFSGADPLETIKRFVAGHITKPATIRELKLWTEQPDYSPQQVIEALHNAIDARVIDKNAGIQLVRVMESPSQTPA